MKKYEYQHFEVYSTGDFAYASWINLLEMLNSGFEIASAASDSRCIHYILRCPVRTHKESK